MGCVICNILSGIPPMVENGDDAQRIIELKEEICNDIATGHPEMVNRIQELCKTRRE